MFAEYGDSKSSWINVNMGCAQSSVLGPKLFAIYCKDLPKITADYAHIVANERQFMSQFLTKISTLLRQKSCHENYLEFISNRYHVDFSTDHLTATVQLIVDSPTASLPNDCYALIKHICWILYHMCETELINLMN